MTVESSSSALCVHAQYYQIRLLVERRLPTQIFNGIQWQCRFVSKETSELKFFATARKCLEPRRGC
jgi:hypothetical protein